MIKEIENTLEKEKNININIQPIEKLVLIDQIIETIGKLIAEGLLKPGDTLPSERTLAEMLKVSRTSVRQALKALDVLGVLEIKPGSRTILNKSLSKLLINPLKFMSLLHNVGILELFKTRKIIEVSLAQLAAENVEEEDIKRMENALKKAEELVGEPDEYLFYEMEFHEAIFKAAKERILTAMMASINNLLLESREKTVKLFNNLADTLDQHFAIFNAIKNRSPNKAGEAMFCHLSEVERVLKKKRIANNAKK